MNRLFALFTAALACAAPVLLQAQNLMQTPPAVKQISPPVQIWQPPRLVVTAPGELPIRLEAVRVRGELNGRQAFTEIELTFYNPNRRVLEGELQFPLLAGQSIAGFAMDVNGVLREAVPVDKARGQQVFEDVIRTRIDPGLLEVTQGNNFKLRVYPIPAQGRKQVVLRITETLNEIGGARDKGRVVYRLPAAFGETVDEFRLDVSIIGKPQILRNPVGDINFRSDGGNGDGTHWQAHALQRNYTGKGVIEFSAAISDVPTVSTQRFEGKTYFLADLPVAHREAPRAVPNRVGLVWDASGSGAARDHGREFALLDAYFRKMRSGEVRLTCIRNDAEPVKTFRVVDGDWRELKRALMDTAYDGATNLGAFRPEADVAEYLLFSDGLSNFGEQPFAVAKVPLFTVSAAIKSDPVFLAFAAHRSGGQFIDLIKETPTEAAHKLLNAVTRVELLDGTGVSQVLLQSPFPQGGRIQIAGVLDEVSGSVPLNVVQPGFAAQRINVAVRSGSTDSSLPATAWAHLKVNELDAEHNLNRAEIRRLGQRFKLVTRETSLIVLDRVEDYARFEIQPPPELRADYERVTANLARSRAGERKSHLEQIVARFAEKVKWWDTDFVKLEREAEQKRKDAESKQKEERIGVTGSNLSLDQSRARGDVQAAAKANGPVVYIAPMSSPAVPAMAPPPEVQISASRVIAADAVASPQRQMVGAAGKRDKYATGSEPAETIATIQLQKWQPDSAYAKRMREAADADLYRIYLDEKPGYANSVAFYLDAADIFIERRQNALAIRILSNLAEMDLENRHILRVLGYRLLQAKAPKLAIPVLKRVREMSPEEPQSYRDLGLAYAADNQPQAAIDALNEVVIRPWHDRFPDIELVALAELNAIYATSVAANSVKLDVSHIDPRLLKNLPLDLRAVLAWDADNTDIDLWVTDPNGEQAYYGHQLTRQGGRMSRDFTGGYGPEEFSLKTAKPGKYRVEARYFGDNRQNVTGPTTLWVRLTTHFGSASQQDQTVTLRLKDRSESVLVGEFEIK